MSDYIITNGGELYHYGVKGMKWGHRKAQYYDTMSKNTAWIGSKAKTSVGKIAAQNISSSYKYAADRQRSISNAKGLRNKYAVAYGHQGAANRMRAQAKMNQQQASYAKTKLGKQIFNVSAENSKHRAEYHQSVANASGIGKKAVAATKGIFTQKVTTLSGRTISNGKAICESLVPGLSLMRDIEYARKHDA